MAQTPEWKRFFKYLYDAIPYKGLAYSALKRVWTPSQDIYQHLHFRGPFRVQLDNASFTMIHHGYLIENEIFWGGIQHGFEAVSLSVWVELCKNSDVIFDVGASTGIYTLVAKAVRPDAEIHSFEPLPKVFGKLADNCRLNDFKVVLNRTAVSDSDGSGIFYLPEADHVYTATLNPNFYAGGVSVRQLQVPKLCLATYIERRGIKKIDLMKIDVETHEAEVLAGMGRHLSEMRPTMLLEILSAEAGERLDGLLSGLGYVYFDIDEVNPPKRTKRLTKSGRYNFLACSPQIAARLGLS